MTRIRIRPTALLATVALTIAVFSATATWAGKPPERPAETLTIVDLDGSTVTLTVQNLRAMPQVAVKEHICVGEEVGFIGIADYSGVLLTDVLKKAKAAQAPGDYKKRNMYILLKGTDAYQVITTWYDLETPGGSRAMIAIDKNGKPLPPAVGKFRNVFPADKYFGRSIMCLDHIEIHVVPGVVEKKTEE